MAVMPKYYKIHTDGCGVELEPIYTELVPVVRCKDCKFYDIDEDGWYFCNCFGGLHQPEADDFCSYGERKGGGA